MAKYTEADLDSLINVKLDDAKECASHPHVCNMLATDAGRERIFNRVKEILLEDGNPSIEGALALIESELIFSVEN